MVLLAKLENRVQPVRRVRRVILDYRAYKELKVKLVLRVSKV
jgi:hypothetical protein